MQDNRVSFEPEVGVAIERPKTSWAPEVYSVELRLLTIPQFEAFQRWYKLDLHHGVLPFEFYHPITRVRSAWKIVKGSPPYSVAKTRRAAPGAKCIALSFSIVSFPVSIPDGYLLQESGDYVLQEDGGRIIVDPGSPFDVGA
ncbi:hypothetical protein CDV49_08285 [Haematobacter genomosp. 1]|uniref:Uncharacterized protein n=1 Tax=Haematobacter genomosp. 1 TaxID=366618 RepID=A0A212ABY1_9RHOB|nr:hypothetical protein CDV49_08285 [Haematobacter genomosp. 1]